MSDERLAKLREIDERWWGVHTSTDLDTGRVIYGGAHRHAGADIGFLLGQVRELSVALDAATARLQAAEAVVGAVRRHLRAYDPACPCEACREDRASKMVEELARYDAARTGLPYESGDDWGDPMLWTDAARTGMGEVG